MRGQWRHRSVRVPRSCGGEEPVAACALMLGWANGKEAVLVRLLGHVAKGGAGAMLEWASWPRVGEQG